MILKLIMIGFVLVAVYKFMGGTFQLPYKSKAKDDDRDSDTLDECANCGTYVTRIESIEFKGRYYCSKECLQN